MKLRTLVTSIPLALLAGAALAQCPPSDLDGAPDNQRDDLDYFYVLTGGLFPTGNVPNGDNASGGTFRYMADDPIWGIPLGAWRRDDWFPQNAGLALTLQDGPTTVYDNNGIEDGSHGGFYDSSDSVDPEPGLYRGYCMSNNWDFTYATYFRLEEPATFTRLIGYFDGDGYSGGFDPFSVELAYRMNVWSAVHVSGGEGGPEVYDPACATFRGDVLSVETTDHAWSASDTGVARQFPPSFGRDPDPIWRLVIDLPEPVTLPAGHYFFNVEALVRLSPVVDVRPGNALNQVNTSSQQLVPIAVLSAPGFDAPAEIDPGSAVFRDAHSVTGATTNEDVNGDGLLDLVLRFRARQLRKPTPAECANPAIHHVLSGSTYGGRPFSGSDRVSFIGPDCS